MSKLIYILCIFVLLFVSFLSGKIAMKTCRKDSVEKLNTIYFNIVYSFAENKEKELLNVSTSVVRNIIISVAQHQSKTEQYSYLCPMLNERFKKIVLNNLNRDKKEYLIHQKEFIDKNISIDFRREREYFMSGYKKLLDFCKKIKE